MSRYAFDIKTSAEDYLGNGKLRTPFPEAALQVCAYINAPLAAVWRARQITDKKRYYLLNETERALAVPTPEVDGGVAILLTPTRYAVHPLRTDEAVFESFLHLIDAAHFPLELAKGSVRDALVAPRRATDTADPFAGLPKE